ncbi:MAG: class I SAM-dependent methyltransferase [Clostridiales bacterium]|nr:class I SAM-dependent methyltransferase [Clostridiales bacterium]
MDEDKNKFTYAHNDTGTPERESRTAGLNKLCVSDKIARLRKSAHEREVPTASEETLNFLLTLALAKQPKNILEVGCAEGITSLALLDICEGSHLSAIEREEQFIRAFNDNLGAYAGRYTLLSGDAADICKTLDAGAYDFIFLDCAKVQYIKLLPDLKRILKKGGVLVADDVLMYGWVNGEVETPKKRKMLVEHIREYITAVTNDDELQTAILNVGNGVAVSVKIN